MKPVRETYGRGSYLYQARIQEQTAFQNPEMCMTGQANNPAGTENIVKESEKRYIIF
jgi:hypothetical protein